MGAKEAGTLCVAYTAKSQWSALTGTPGMLCVVSESCNSWAAGAEEAYFNSLPIWRGSPIVSVVVFM